MKSIILGLMILSIASVHATESREYKKVSSTEAVVKIQTEEQDGTQAAAYVDAQENKKFIADLRKDKNSALAKLISEIELANCETNSTEENPWIDGCGQVIITDSVLTSFGRGGWASAGAGYSYFIGFQSDGSGRFFESDYILTIYESVEAQAKDDGNYAGFVLKTLSFDNILKLPKKQVDL
ncbi:MAG: hypothetical protein K2Q18_15285 [Bdellovibrionales bacterium]|nr:hypothetical protein [Bdellovibrionales bacterium]